jgi:alpha-L-fucosidase
MPAQHSFDFYETVYDANPKILVNSRIGNGFGDIGIPGDNVIPDEASANTWEGIATTNNSWGYKSYDNDWKSPIETLYWLVANVSKGGNFLLNVGPDGAGTIPPESVENLLAVGKWLKVNGEAIYGTGPWKVDHEGPTRLEMKGTRHRSQAGFTFDFKSNDYWFTQKDGKVYVIALARPEGNTVSVKALTGLPIVGIKVLGESGNVIWSKKDDAVEVILPDMKNGGMGYALAVEIDNQGPTEE